MNLFKRFQRLVPNHPVRVVDVIEVNATEVYVEEVGGPRFKVRGEAAVGDHVYIRNGVIEGAAPLLPLEVIEE